MNTRTLFQLEHHHRNDHIDTVFGYNNAIHQFTTFKQGKDDLVPRALSELYYRWFLQYQNSNRLENNLFLAYWAYEVEQRIHQQASSPVGLVDFCFIDLTQIDVISNSLTFREVIDDHMQCKTYQLGPEFLERPLYARYHHAFKTSCNPHRMQSIE